MALASIDVGLLFEVVWASALAGAVVSVLFALVVLFGARSAETRRAGRGTVAMAYGAAAVLVVRGVHGARGLRRAPHAVQGLARSAPRAELDRAVERDRLEQLAVVGDEQQRAVVGVRARSRAARSPGRSRWLVGSSSTSQFAPDAISSARLARVRSPGREAARRRAPTASLLEPELGQQRARLLLRQPALRDERVEQRAGAVEAGARLVERRRSARPGRPSACPRRAAAGRAAPSTSVVLPLPFGPTSATRSPHASSRSSGPSAKLPRRSTAPSSRTVTSPERSPPPKRSCSSQRRHGLSTVVEPLDRLLGRAHLRRLLLRALGARGATDLVGLVAESLALAHAGLRPLALAARAVGRAGRARVA